jgi:CRISPR-associated protein Cas1
MTDRVLDISETAARLHARGSLLAIARMDAPEKPPVRGARRHDPDLGESAEFTIPFAEIAAVVAAHPQVSFSRAAVAGLAHAGGILVVCDDKFQPAAMFLPLTGHHLQSERFRIQAQAPKPLQKQIWKQIVCAKITAQARALESECGSKGNLARLCERVKSGDPENIEGQAARIYWRRIFDDEAFVRDPDGEPPNNLLNYGYAVLRAVTARAICAAGLHPALGVHHHNRYDPFCLASDLMEPLRPLVDRAVCALVRERGLNIELDRETRGLIIAALTQKLDFNGERRAVFDILNRMAASLFQAFESNKPAIALPDF